MTKTDFQEPRMQFIPGGRRFEPILPLRKGNPKIKVNWFWVILLTILMLATFIVLIFFS